jgi:LysM repeat protein
VRTVAYLLFFAAAFGLAGFWQSHRLKELERERALAIRIQEGELSQTPSGLLAAGTGVVVIGRPSGAEPIGGGANDEPAATPVVQTPQQPEEQAAPQPAPEQPAPLADFELSVEQGQTLSSIAREHYGSASPALVRALAAYNGLADGNALPIGQKLKLPSASVLVH